MAVNKNTLIKAVHTARAFSVQINFFSKHLAMFQYQYHIKKTTKMKPKHETVPHIRKNKEFLVTLCLKSLLT